MNKRRSKRVDRQLSALVALGRAAVRFANTVNAHGEAWDTETDVLNKAVEYARTVPKHERDAIGGGEP